LAPVPDLAIRYAKQGCLLGITGRRTALLDDIAAQFPGQVFTATFDVTGNDNLAHLNELIVALGGMDMLIYNSGYGEISDTIDATIDRQTVGINVKGFTEIVGFAFQYFARQGHGHIVATSSVAAVRGNSMAPAYSASKAYMSTYMEGLYIKARKQKTGITITDIQPGFVDTKMAKGNKRFWVATPEKAVTQMMRAIAQKRFRVYITRRWILIAILLRFLPLWIYRRFG
jgi:short-subunit dehydrogenase